jgi:hypothetical protein
MWYVESIKDKLLPDVSLISEAVLKSYSGIATELLPKHAWVKLLFVITNVETLYSSL